MLTIVFAATVPTARTRHIATRRYAFQAEEGRRLVVADYGQLELRLLAHITGCKSMLEAFSSGGCFHSRTAVGMFDYVKKAVDDGEVYLEWDYSKGERERRQQS
jgi:DNA polymerase I